MISVDIYKSIYTHLCIYVYIIYIERGDFLLGDISWSRDFYSTV